MTFETQPKTAATALEEIQQILGAERSSVEAEIFLEEALRKVEGWTGSRSDLLAAMVSPSVRLQARRWAEERVQTGRPVQYLTGWQVFLDHRYHVGEGVLIPRPESEGLVMLVDDWLKSRLKSQAQMIRSASLRGLEFGVGSGALSIELLSRWPELEVLGSEISERARAFAVRNSERILGSGSHSRLRLVESLEGNVLERADFLISNPPYLDPVRAEEETTEEVRKFEPALALFGPQADPSFFYRYLARTSKSLLRHEGGALFVELPHERAEEIRGIFVEAGWKQVSLHADLTGRARYLSCESVAD